jgi:hypothetical protein
MKFVDEVRIRVEAGDGCTSFRREKYLPAAALFRSTRKLSGRQGWGVSSTFPNTPFVVATLSSRLRPPASRSRRVQRSLARVTKSDRRIR